MKRLILALSLISTPLFAHNMSKQVIEEKVISIVKNKLKSDNISNRSFYSLPSVMKSGMTYDENDEYVVNEDSFESSFAGIRLNPIIALVDTANLISDKEDIDRSNISLTLDKGDITFELTCALSVTEKEDFDSEKFIYTFDLRGCELENLDNGKTKNFFLGFANNRIVREHQL